MTNHNSKTLVLPKSTVKETDGVVILPLKKWEVIKEALEDLEMHRSKTLAKEIDKRRKEKETIPLGKLLKKYHL